MGGQVRPSAAIGGAAAAAAVTPLWERAARERELRRRCRRHRALVLTYDDGPGRRLTPAVLDLLAARRARASFFAVGELALGAPDLLDRALAEGHEVGCHGYRHQDAWNWPPRLAVEDLERGYDALGRWVPSDGCFRPPRGRLSRATLRTIRRRQAPLAFWTVDSGDTHAQLPEPSAVAGVVDGMGGGVVLLHDFDRDPEEPDRDAFVLGLTERLLDVAERRNMAVLTFGELTSRRRAA
jgi:peptidoglycan/xylan/chitin deacetylase (PgdA/CDA1 family)